MTKLNEKQIAAYEAKGFRRWTKGNMDRLYINIENLGAEISYYGTGNVRSAKWQGEQVSNADGRRLHSSKLFVDVNTGELSVTTNFEPYWTDAEQITVEDAAKAIIAEIEAELAEPETTEETTELDPYVERLWYGKYDPEGEAKAVYDKGHEYPLDGTPAEYIRRVAYIAVGNSYINLDLEPWELADSLISAGDLLLADGVDLYDVAKAIRKHVQDTAYMYELA